MREDDVAGVGVGAEDEAAWLTGLVAEGELDGALGLGGEVG